MFPRGAFRSAGDGEAARGGLLGESLVEVSIHFLERGAVKAVGENRRPTDDILACGQFLGLAFHHLLINSYGTRCSRTRSTEKSIYSRSSVYAGGRDPCIAWNTSASYAPLYGKLLTALYKRVNKFFTEKLALALDEC